jgi:hypothetical protein
MGKVLLFLRTSTEKQEFENQKKGDAGLCEIYGVF